MNQLLLTRILRVSSHLLAIIGFLLLMYGIVSEINLLFINFQTSNTVQTQTIFQLIRNLIVFLVIALVLWYVGDRLGDYSEKMLAEVHERVLGLLQLGEPTIVLNDIALRLNMTPQQLTQIILKLASQGKLANYILNIQSGTLALREQTSKTSLSSDIEVRAKLIELEKLRKEDKISEEAYNILKDEIQKGRKSL
ncbi:MAG: hypothetical protein QXO30_01920 [Candidatus Caldarchaeum sp.]